MTEIKTQGESHISHLSKIFSEDFIYFVKIVKKLVFFILACELQL